MNAIVRLLIDSYRTSRAANELRQLDARLLRDIGIERGRIDEFVRGDFAPVADVAANDSSLRNATIRRAA